MCHVTLIIDVRYREVFHKRQKSNAPVKFDVFKLSYTCSLTPFERLGIGIAVS